MFVLTESYTNNPRDGSNRGEAKHQDVHDVNKRMGTSFSSRESLELLRGDESDGAKTR